MNVKDREIPMWRNGFFAGILCGLMIGAAIYSLI
jgi:formate/nitrite transporter FocA (FNT family)